MPKNLFKRIVVFILNIETRLILRKYRPKIIGVTGSVGKTSTKEAIVSALSARFFVRGSMKSYNSELGVPLTVIGEKTAWLSFFGWLKIIWRGILLIALQHGYPDWLVLEIGADRPGDIKNLVKWLPIDIAVLTRLPDVPVHIEFFKDKNKVIEEKMSLPLSVPVNGAAILNIDDPNIIAFQDRIVARKTYYGLSDGAEVKAKDREFVYRQTEQGQEPCGFSFKAIVGERQYPVKILGAIGLHLVYPVLAAIAVAKELGIDPQAAAEELTHHTPPPGRLRLIPGQRGATILDDTYNSSPVAMAAALETLSNLERTGRRIAVIGNMMELGIHTAEEHKKIGTLAAGICDLLITVGVRAKFAAEAAERAGLDAEQIKHFAEAKEAGDFLADLVDAGDLVLVKGSQSARMEKVVEKIMAEPEKKKDLLVRQEDEWQGR